MSEPLTDKYKSGKVEQSFTRGVYFKDRTGQGT